MKIGITGQNGFIGYHLAQTILHRQQDYTLVPFQKPFFEDEVQLDGFVTSCDVLVHLAAVNRASSDQEVYDSNIKINTALKEALIRSGFNGHLIFASSSQEDSASLYGRAKKESREFLEGALATLGGKFTGIIIPNVFGPFCRPNYNSFIATFCDKILQKETPEVINDATVPLIYVGNLVDQIWSLVQDQSEEKLRRILADVDIKVSEVLALLNGFNERYIKANTIPVFNNSFELQLFNTFRSYIDVEAVNPVALVKHSDERGFFSEIIRTEIGGQFSYSTTLPGITRGNHFHTRKIERFTVIAGEAKIALRKIGSSVVHEFFLSGEKPSYVDMPIWYTHNISNVGNSPLITSFWINEAYDPQDADTYFENV